MRTRGDSRLHTANVEIQCSAAMRQDCISMYCCPCLLFHERAGDSLTHEVLGQLLRVLKHAARNALRQWTGPERPRTCKVATCKLNVLAVQAIWTCVAMEPSPFLKNRRW